MDHTQAAAAAIVIVALAVLSFLLGADIAESRARKATKRLTERLQWEQKNRFELAKYVRANWPNEYAAYQRGHAEGYQQGIIQSPELTE